MSECVDHPAHYKMGEFECIEVMKDVFGSYDMLSFCKLNAFKYLWRSEQKGEDEDIKKAIWYLNKYLEIRGETI